MRRLLKEYAFAIVILLYVLAHAIRPGLYVLAVYFIAETIQVLSQIL